VNNDDKRIEALQADNARLRGVLDKIQSGTLGLPDSVMEEGPAATWQWMWVESQKAARAALSSPAPGTKTENLCRAPDCWLNKGASCADYNPDRDRDWLCSAAIRDAKGGKT
jgi:hypothetical protein